MKKQHMQTYKTKNRKGQFDLPVVLIVGIFFAVVLVIAAMIVTGKMADITRAVEGGGEVEFRFGDAYDFDIGRKCDALGDIGACNLMYYDIRLDTHSPHDKVTYYQAGGVEMYSLGNDPTLDCSEGIFMQGNVKTLDHGQTHYFCIHTSDTSPKAAKVEYNSKLDDSYFTWEWVNVQPNTCKTSPTLGNPDCNIFCESVTGSCTQTYPYEIASCVDIGCTAPAAGSGDCTGGLADCTLFSESECNLVASCQWRL